MPRPASLNLLVLASSVALLLAVSGCIEVKDPPPHGDFTIEVDSEGMFFVPDEGGELEGPRADVETDLHDEHPEYSWDIEGVGEFPGRKVEVPPTTVGLRTATYDLEYYEQHQCVPVFVATLPDLTGIYFVVGNATQLDENLTIEEGLEIEMGPSLIEHHVDDNGAVMEFSGRLSDGIAVNVSLEEGAPNSTAYVTAILVSSGDIQDEEVGSIAIFPGEAHHLFYVDGDLNITISRTDDPTNITFEGLYADLPKEYRTDIGKLLWEGHVGETEETPGMASFTALLAFIVVAAVATRARRR